MRGHQDIPMKNGDEYDAFTGWRQVYGWKPGTIKNIKRAFNKRVRQRAKKACTKDMYCDM